MVDFFSVRCIEKLADFILNLNLSTSIEIVVCIFFAVKFSSHFIVETLPNDCLPKISLAERSDEQVSATTIVIVVAIFD